MPIYSITDIYLGKQNTPIFQTQCACLCPDDCALTIIGMSVSKKGTEDSFCLYMQADSPAVAQEWLEALQHLLKEHGRELLDENVEPSAPQGENKEEGKVGRRLSVVKPSATSDDPFDVLGTGGGDGGFVGQMVPASRPENPFGAEDGEDWNPFGDGDPFGAPSGAVAADPFAGAGFDAFETQAQSTAVAGLDPDLAKYLNYVGLTELGAKFAAEHVDLETLRMFTKDDFNAMNVKLGPSIKILNSLKSWKP